LTRLPISSSGCLLKLSEDPRDELRHRGEKRERVYSASNYLYSFERFGPNSRVPL
jgi:hypothetical protein